MSVLSIFCHLLGKLEAVTTWPQPITVTELSSFLGFYSYYWRFVVNFAKIAHPLNELPKNEVEGEVESSETWEFKVKKAHTKARDSPI